jgi:TonB-dependent receptor
MRSTVSGKLLRTAVLGGVSTVALAFAAPGFAQNTAAPAAAKDDGTVVVVTGIRGSLQRAMNIKKNADGVVDGIAAEDIGKYPDTNLADSLQRIPGVSINRVSGEGEQVTVRGFGPGYNTISVDGRIMPATAIGVIGGGQGADLAQGNTRAFDFSQIASDGVQAVQVYKTGRADIDSGGIGASINVVTLQPLVHSGTQASLTVKALTNDNPGLGTVLKKKSVTPEISGAYQWTNDSGKFGIAAFGSYQEKTGSNREDTVNTWNIMPYSSCAGLANCSTTFLTSGTAPAAANIHNAPTSATQLIAEPTDSRLGYSELDTKRSNGEIVARFKPTEALTITANTFYAEAKQQEARSELTNWFSRNPYAAVTFDGNSTIDTVVSATDTVPTGKDQGYENEMRAIKSNISSTGLNLKYHPNDRWTFSVDASTSKSTAEGGNPDGSSSTTVSTAQTYVASNTTTFGPLQAPYQNVTLNPAKSATGQQDAASLSSGYSRQVFSKQTDKIDQAKFDATYAVDDSSHLSFGLDAYKNINESSELDYLTQFGDWGGNNPGDVLKYGNTPIKTYCLACQFKSVSLDADANTAYRFNAVPAYAGLVAYYSSPSFQNVLPVGTAKANTPNVNGFAHNKVEEDVKSGYAQFAMKSDFLGRPVKILAGVRYEDTHVTVTAFQNIPTGVRWDQKNNFSIIQGSGVQPYAQKAHYSNLLPSLDMAMSVTDQITGRMSFSVTDARPQYSQMYATTSVNAPGDATYLTGNYTASSGNPALKPLVSENFDVSGEWYYGKNSYVSLGYYRKAVQNFVGNGTTKTPLFGLRDPSSGQPGTTSGAAVTAIKGLGQSVGVNNMSAMTILITQAGGDVAKATQEYKTFTAPDGHVSADLDSLEVYLWANPSWKVTSASTDPIASFTLSQPINNQTANIDGFEFSWQHFFGDTGFGLAASATTVNGDVRLDNAANPFGASQFALEGLSNTYNITGIYEKYGWSGRVVYNWRDKYLTTANATQSGGLYTAAYGQWDASVNYDLTPKVVLSLEALNLNKAHLVQYVRVPTDVVLYQELDTRYELGLRYKF